MLKNEFFPENAGLTCKFRESALTFGFQRMQDSREVEGCLLHCCIVTHKGGGYVRICKYDGGPLPIDKIIEQRSCLQKHGESRCAGCVFLKEPAVEKKKYLFDYLVFAHFTFCNFRCEYCYLMKPQWAGFISKRKPFFQAAPAVREMIENDWLDPNGEAHWGGGEPLILNEFEELQSMVIDHGLTVTLNTNASIVSDVIMKNANNPRQNIVCSVDAGTKEKFNEVKGRDMHQRVWNNLKTYVDAGVNVAVKYIFTHQNDQDKEMDAFVNQIKWLGSVPVVVDLDYRPGMMTDERIAQAKKLMKRLKDEGISPNVGGPGNIAFEKDPFQENLASNN